MNVRFTETPDVNRVRDALGKVGIDTSKVTLQPVTSRPTELIIHAPQLEQGTEAERRVDEDKRRIIRGLQSLSPAGDVAAGRVNINSIDAPGIEAELRQVIAHRCKEQVPESLRVRIFEAIQQETSIRLPDPPGTFQV